MSESAYPEYVPKLSSRVGMVPNTYKNGKINSYRGQSIAAYFNIDICIEESAKVWYPEHGFVPKSSGAIGFDLRAILDSEPISIKPNEHVLINTGVRIQPKEIGINGCVINNDSLLIVSKGIQIINPDDTNVIQVLLTNIDTSPKIIYSGFPIAKLIFIRYELPRLNFVDTFQQNDEKPNTVDSESTYQKNIDKALILFNKPWST